ncbi:DUF1573 domain-containing protein [Crocinitomicaceae bacterium]|nr:DUF1573 domain-containing protein [Crocinitomicaceae bacterium]
MKNTIFLCALFLLGMASGVNAQQVQNGPQITFEKEVHDYGKMKQGADATVEFTFTNTGNAPLILSQAKGSCSCTVPKWPKEPIAPGKSATIKVKYDSKRTGAINKSVTITSNAVNEPTKVIRIKGYVQSSEESGAPLNSNGPTSGK